jgi:hypothetical protein
MGVLDVIPIEWDLFGNTLVTGSDTTTLLTLTLLDRKDVPASEPDAKSKRVISEHVYILYYFNVNDTTLSTGLYN